MGQVLACGKRVKLNARGATAIANGYGATGPAARTRAIALAQNQAVLDAWAEASSYDCPEACPVLRFDLEVSRPATSKPVQAPPPAPAGFWMVNAECEWAGKVSCREEAQMAAVERQEQDLKCSDPWTIISEGHVSGSKVKGKPAGPIEEARLTAKALRNFADVLKDELQTVTYSYRCPPTRCPNKLMRFRLWPAELVSAGPMPPDNHFEWFVQRWWRVEVCCR